MKLTREQYIKCLNSLYNNVPKVDECEYQFERDALLDVINAHFENPPLKFEENRFYVRELL